MLSVGCAACALAVGCAGGTCTCGGKCGGAPAVGAGVTFENFASDRSQRRIFSGPTGQHYRDGRRVCNAGETPMGARGPMSNCVCSPADTPCQERGRRAHGRASTRVTGGGGPRASGPETTVTIPAAPSTPARRSPFFFRADLIKRLGAPLRNRVRPSAWAANRTRNAPAPAPRAEPTPEAVDEIAEAWAELDRMATEVLAAFEAGEITEDEAVGYLLQIVEVAEALSAYEAPTTAGLGAPAVGDFGSDLANWWNREAAPVLAKVDQAIDPIVDAVLPAVPVVGPAVQSLHRARMQGMYGRSQGMRPASAPSRTRAPTRAPGRDVSAEIAALRSLMARSMRGEPAAQNRVRGIKDRAAAGDPTARRQWKALLALSEAA